MFWDRIEPVVTDRVKAAVDDAYEVFSNYQMRAPLVFCDCNVCMTHEQARALLSTPLRMIPQELLAEYTNSAHGYDRELIETQFKYLLPRYLDLIADCKPPSHQDIETCLDRLGSAGYRTSWPAREVEVIGEFFDAFVEANLVNLHLLKWPVGLRLEFDMIDVLVMVVRASGDLERVLDVFDKAPDPEAAVHMASMRADVENTDGRHLYRNAFLEDRPAEAAMIGEWLMRDSVTERIMEAAGLLDDPSYDGVLEMGL
ncbi:MAG: hypothetical protein HKN11_14280 [Rhizobiales bacterium]|nr:hypothetical protein [Hyphomicrobiales bacterium]